MRIKELVGLLALAQQAIAHEEEASKVAAAHELHGTFKFGLDYFAGRTGYFTVEGYDGVQPTLIMERGKTYEFDQTNAENWFHPLGFGYEPDGAHEGVDELEAGVGNGDEPIYIINGELSDLDTYEPEFFYPLDAWKETQYTVQLTVTDPDVNEIFYFCHIHNGMSGRILIVDDASAVDDIDYNYGEIMLYEPYQAGHEDQKCGTWEAGSFYGQHNLEAFCPGQDFICADESANTQFVKCMEAIDCKMNHDMRVETNADPVATWMHQMIPHHDNAVNMAKILLKTEGDNLDDEVADLMVSIINSQNQQITFMESYLRDNEYPTATEAGCAFST
ncbi:unnamed protein product [Chrysoparadoxa australica]